MKTTTLTLILVLSISSASVAQLKEGFNPDEAKSLIAICNSYTFLDLYGSDAFIIPKEYRKVYTSEVIGLDNMFQVYEGDKVGVINFRGSTAKTSSWLENFYSAMIPGEGVIEIDNKNCPYKFASNTAAAVHAGYALAVVLLSPVLIEQINNLNNKGIYHILITGHSQGGALAHLCHAYLENLSESEISSENVFKTYAFANPMCGNEEFAKEYNVNYSDNNMSFSIINPADFVPKMPMHFQEDDKLFGSFDFKSRNSGIERSGFQNIKNLILFIIEPSLKAYVNFSNHLIEKSIATFWVSIDMPRYAGDINYFQTGALHELEPFSNPEVLADTLKMNRKEIAKLKQDKNGDYNNKNTSFLQHKPYNYYLAILEEYFSEDYRELDLRYLPEDIEYTASITHKKLIQ